MSRLTLMGTIVACLLAVAASAHENRAKNYTCYRGDNKSITFCVPVDQSLIWVEADKDTLHAHYESGFGGYSVSIADTQPGYTPPVDKAAGFAASRLGRGIAGVNPPAQAMSFYKTGEKSVLVIEAGGPEERIFAVEVHTPDQIFIVEAVEFLIEENADSRQFEKLRAGVLYDMLIDDQPLAQLVPLDGMEPVE